MTTSAPATMTASHITIRFGGLTAVGDVSFTIPEKGIVSLIGPNGAGKTTFFNVLTGLYRPTSGVVRLAGRDVTGMAPHRIASLGLARTFQNIRLFNLMTAEENVLVAMHSHMKSGIVDTVLRTPRQRREEREGREFARELLDFVGIGKVAGEYARNLSYGDQRRLEVARALALRPKVLLLDEPTAGMNPQESARFVEFVHDIRDNRGVSILLIEHDMSVVMRVSERVTVLDRGEKIAEGRPEEIKSDERVVQAYLGKTGTHGYGHDRSSDDRSSDDRSSDDGSSDAGRIMSAAPVSVREPSSVRSGATAAPARAGVVREPSSVRSGEELLAVRDLHVYYGNISAVKGLNVSVRKGEIVTLIGSNGAGKSTTLRTISGLIRPRQGDILYRGASTTTMPGHRIVGEGICHSPEGRRIFPRMTVQENLELGAFLRDGRSAIEADLERVLELFPRLRERVNQKAGTMSGGEQQMLAVGRALMGNPTLLLLDEPSMGLAPVLVDLIFDTIQTIRDQGTTVLLVEQNALAALRIADYAYVLESGSLKLEGPARELAKDEEVIKAYLGG